jgi:hypothetical protein
LTLPPSWAEFIQPESTYRTIEELILKGKSGYFRAIQINTLHLLTTLGELEYQTWPENRIPERLRSRGADSLNFRLSRSTRKAVEAAAKSLRFNVVDFTGRLTPKPSDDDPVSPGLIQKAGESRTAKQSKDGKRSGGYANAKVSLEPQSQQLRSKKQQSQSQQSQNQPP